MDEPKLGYDAEGRKKFWRRTTENQIAVRGSKALGSYLVARGTSILHKPDYVVTYTHYAPRYNTQGTVIVGAHTQKTIEFTRSDYGRNFQHSDHNVKARKRARASTYIKSGRIIPVLGYGYMAYNVMGQPTRIQERRPGEGWAYADLAYAAEGALIEGVSQYQQGSSPLQIVESTFGAAEGYAPSDAIEQLAERIL